ncbi:MAG: cysteine--tRNA ligase [Nitrospirae bacterium]|nr:cysteine--tRNA ligase [Nitrospirota bacterium]
MLKVSNTLSGKKEPFRPRQTDRGHSVGMYVCGVTVYDRCHLGHARSAVVFDVIRGYLEYKGYRVQYVRNFTDVDDKIINRANQEAKSWQKIAETYIKAYEEDMKRLGVRPADLEPRATEYIPEMIALIQKLIKKEVAYVIGGNVYYRVKRFKGYGKLSRRDTNELLSGARVEVDERKENPLDFALWKASKPGEPTWDSPWGPGRPGWHIECSAMALKLLGRGLDIHGGGKDLIFPHHENEIAQSEGATGKPFARYWVHNGFVNVNQEKMSKSLGNFFTIQEIFEKSSWPEAVTAEVLRYFLVSTQYRSPIDFSDDALKTAKSGLDNFYRMFQKLEEPAATASKPYEKKLREALKQFPKRFEAAMDDDFNTALAVSELQQLRAVANAAMDRGISLPLSQAVLKLFQRYGAVLGIFSLTTGQWTTATETVAGFSESEIGRLIHERDEARRKKDWSRSDAIRKQLAEAGIILEDRPDGTTRIRR